jgi:hypothetical protein
LNSLELLPRFFGRNVRLRAANPSLLRDVFLDPFWKRDHTRKLQESPAFSSCNWRNALSGAFMQRLM